MQNIKQRVVLSAEKKEETPPPVSKLGSGKMRIQSLLWSGDNVFRIHSTWENSLLILCCNV
jgi:hypothetical protein